MRLNHLRDRASEKGHGKEYPLLLDLILLLCILSTTNWANLTGHLMIKLFGQSYLVVALYF